MIKAQNTWNLA